MSIKVIINGAKGKMGREAVLAVTAEDELNCVAQMTRKDNLGQIIAKTEAHVVVDLTVPAAVYENACTIIEHGAHPVIGTTGLSPEQINDLKERCKAKKLGGVIAPNFSIGAVLMMQFAEQASRYYQDVEIIEAHHPQKLDAPSGTAIKTAALIDKGDIPIHSIRLPGIVAEQTVFFGAPHETLSIAHRSIHRGAFMPGIVLACKKVMGLDKLVYGLEHLL